MANTRLAVGLIETRGVVALTAGIEAMLKTADVSIISVERITSGFFAASVQGSVAAVRQALEAGTAAVKEYGVLRSSKMYPQPHAVATGFLASSNADLLNRGSQARSLDGGSGEKAG
jgi:ethanolamine utilization protein EutM